MSEINIYLLAYLFYSNAPYYYYYYYFVFIWIARLDHFGWELHFVVFGLLIKSLCGIFVKFLHYVRYFVGCVS